MRRVVGGRAMRGAVLAIMAGTALTLASRLSPATASAQVAPALVDLSGAEELRRQFNDDRGHVRLVLLLSPT